MRKLLLALVLPLLSGVLAAQSVSGTPVSTTNDASALNIACPALTVGAGDTVAVSVTSDRTSGTISCSDGSSYTSVTGTRATLTGVGELETFVRTNVSAGSVTVTCTYSTSAAFRRIGCTRIASAETASTTDGGNLGSSAGSTTPSTASITTTNANDLIYGAIVTTTSVTFTAGASFTKRISLVDFSTEDRVVSSTGSYSASYTSISPSAGWLMNVIAIKGSGATTTVCTLSALGAGKC